jgi:6-phosphogluconolactonase (cycloisomerase 2 family)
VDPTGRYLYAANSNGGTISEYSIGSDGALTAAATPLSTGGFPIWIVTVAVP